MFSISIQCGDEDSKNATDGLVKINVLLPTGTRRVGEWGAGGDEGGREGVGVKRRTENGDRGKRARKGNG